MQRAFLVTTAITFLSGSLRETLHKALFVLMWFPQHPYEVATVMSPV